MQQLEQERNGSGIKVSIGFITRLFYILLKISSGDSLPGRGIIILGIFIGDISGGGGNPLGGGGTFILFYVFERLSGITLFLITLMLYLYCLGVYYYEF